MTIFVKTGDGQDDVLSWRKCERHKKSGLGDNVGFLFMDRNGQPNIRKESLCQDCYKETLRFYRKPTGSS